VDHATARVRTQSPRGEHAIAYRSRERARRWLSIIALGSQQHKGKRVKERRQTWLKAASSLRDNSVDEFSGNWMAYVSANGRKDEARAARYLERCLELASLLRPSVRDLVAMEGAVFTSWFRNDAQLAVKWVAQIKKLDLIQRLQRIRLNVALGCARRDFDAALGDFSEGGVSIFGLSRAGIWLVM
jgi:hypothetical protein